LDEEGVMAQEQAKSPPVAAAPGTKIEGQTSLEAGGETDDLAQFLAIEAATEAQAQKRPSLAERLRAEQRKTSELKMDDNRPEELSDPAPSNEAKPITRARRAAGPAQRRIAAAAANDDVPSIGGLIFALQQKPSKSPFVVAFAASIAWFVIGGFFAYGLISAQLSAPSTLTDLLANPQALIAALTILIPIAIFWFLALLVWRAQELRLMASAMTEVAVRLAEPDKLAEQSVASLGQTIRRQVAAMNDAISRAIGRAGELETLVHNEVAALERSYSDNELRVRGLISELASERQALTNNSERVSEALKGVGTQVARDLTTASSHIDRKLAERGLQLTELLVTRSAEAAEQVHLAQSRVQQHMPALIERLAQEQERLGHVIDGAATSLSALESAVGDRTTALDNTLKERTTALDNTLMERTEALTSSLATRIKTLETSVGQGALLLDNTLKTRTETFVASVAQGALGLDGVLQERTKLLTASIGQETAALDKTLKDRTEAFTASVGEETAALDKSLRERTETFALSVGQGAIGLDNLLKTRTQLLTAAINEQTTALDKTLKDRTETFATFIGQGAAGLDRLLKDRTEAFATSVGQGASALDKTLKDRTEQFSAFIGQGSAVLDKALKDRIEMLASSIGHGAAALDKTLKNRTELLTASIGQGSHALDKTLRDHSEAFDKSVSHQAGMLGQSLKERTDHFATAINQGAIALDRTLADRMETFTNSLVERSRAVEQTIGQQAALMDKTLHDRTQAATASLSEKLKSIDATFGQRTGEIDRVLAEHTRAVETTFGRQAIQLNEMLANNSTLIRQTADQVGAQSKEAIGVLAAQTQTLREVSRGLLDQIHSLTQRFENQGQAILTAAKALDSSNTKIDSILENRHQAIIGLLHAVNTKGQDLDTVMRSYAGMVENALTNAESRAKQVGAALARDTAGQAQQALAQIERLREEAQAHTARAVGDLKGSFETVITQIGRQLEQMRGQFDQTSRGMRDAAQKTATDLDSLRQEMQRRMESLPQQTAQATAAIRKALADQIKEIEAITPVLTRPAPQAISPEPYRQPQLPARGQPLSLRGEDILPAREHDAPALPQFDARGRQFAPQPQISSELGSVAGSLAQQLSGASHSDRRGPAGSEGYPGQPQAQPDDRQSDRRREGWSAGDHLGEASGADAPGFGSAPQRQDAGYGARGNFAPTQPAGPAQSLRLDEIARAIDHRTAAQVWQRFRAGEQGVLGRHLYSLDGQATFDEISRRYDRDADFHATVDRYIGDFERLLQEAEQTDPDGRMLQNYMTSETGRVYLLLAHASGRLR
jgi:hypothetical protein